MRDEWVEACERNLWKRSGIGRPQENRSYVESGRDEVSVLMQSSDEGAFLLVSESAFAAYQDAQRDAPNFPTNLPMVREDRNDQIYRTAEEKHAAIIADIRGCQQRGQPVLVGTTSIENSEVLSQLLDKEKLSHQVLNAVDRKTVV